MYTVLCILVCCCDVCCFKHILVYGHCNHEKKKFSTDKNTACYKFADIGVAEQARLFSPVVTLRWRGWEKLVKTAASRSIIGNVCIEEVCVCVTINMCLTFVPFPPHYISALLTPHPVIALGILVLSHTGAKTAAFITTSSVWLWRLSYWKSWDWVNLL